jgi:polyhydroxyalkanoate synthesis regulator phasin
MNAPTLNELRAAAIASGREATDDRMEQIRELLVGDHLRNQEQRIHAIETRLRDLEGLMFRRIDALSARIEAMSSEAGTERRRSFDELAGMVTELGNSIRGLSRG